MSTEPDEATQALAAELENAMAEVERQTIEQLGDTPENRIAAMRASVAMLIAGMMQMDRKRMEDETRIFKEATERMQAVCTKAGT